MTPPIRLNGPRVLIKPDVDERAVAPTDSGLLVAKTLEAAVEGSDACESWYTGTVLAVNERPAVFDVRPYVVKRLNELLDEAVHCLALPEIRAVLAEIHALPVRRPRDFAVGDAVVFSHEAGREVHLDGAVYLILDESEILGVLEEAV